MDRMLIPGHVPQVTVQNTSTREAEIVSAKYVVACDGAHSWTRKELDIPMEGDQLGTCPHDGNITSS